MPAHAAFLTGFLDLRIVGKDWGSSAYTLVPYWQCALVDITIYHNYIGIMEIPTFVWDETKQRQNLRKHGVSFEEAATVFHDEDGLVLDDPDHSQQEDRFILLGMSAVLRLLVVCHCYREGDRVIRIISARKATPRERRQYKERQS
jgi:uncharacterized DUF497 family protein